MKTNPIARIAIAVSAAAAVLLASCNTVKGVGKDVQKAGSGIAKGASKVEQKITD